MRGAPTVLLVLLSAVTPAVGSSAGEPVLAPEPALRVAPGCAVRGGTDPAACLDATSPRAFTAPSGEASAEAACAKVPLVDDNCERWVGERIDGPGGGGDLAGAGIDSGRIVAATGTTSFTLASVDAASGDADDADLLLVAQDALTGAVRWQTRYAGPADAPLAYGTEVVADPAGDLVYATSRNYAEGESCPRSATILAFDAATGERAWSAFEGEGVNCPYVEQLDAEAGRLFAIARAQDHTGAELLLASAYVTRGQTAGRRIWSLDWDGDYAGGVRGSAIEAAPGGDRVYLAGAGIEPGAGGFPRFVAWPVLALNLGQTETGDLEHTVAWRTDWVAPTPQSSSPSNPPAALVLSSDGGRLVVVGGAEYIGGLFDIVTLALDTADGRQQWVSHYDGPRRQIKSSFDSVWYHGPLAMSRDGSRVFVAGYSTCLHGVNICADFTTLAYDAATGAQLWEKQYRSEQWIHWFPSVAVTPNGNTVVVSGQARHFRLITGRYATIAYNAATGAERWVARYTDGYSFWNGAALSTDGARVFVAGSTSGWTEGEDFETYDLRTVAYDV